jgi:hypothetical protein
MLEGAAEAPALLGPTGYVTRSRELATGCAALLGVGLLPPVYDAELPDGILELLDASLDGTRIAASALLYRLGIASPEVVKALREFAIDEKRHVAWNAKLALERFGLGGDEASEEDREAVTRGDVGAATRLAHAGRGDREVALLLGSYLERFSHREALQMMHGEVEKALEALGAMGASALAAVPAMQAFAKKVSSGPRWAHEMVIAALVHVSGPSPERSNALIGHLRSRIDEPGFMPREATQLLAALAVGAKHMDVAQRREILGLLRDGKTNWLLRPEMGALFLGLGREIHRELAPELAPKLAASGDLHAFLRTEMMREYAGMESRPVLPGTERFECSVALGAKVGAILHGRTAMFEAIGGSGSDDPAVREVLERLKVEGDPLARYEAARALRRLARGR